MGNGMRTNRNTNHLVVGAGLAGLSCARELSRAGDTVRILEKDRAVGGRCATHWEQGQPMDYGPVLLHGRACGFEEEIRSIQGITLLEDWPVRRRGAGKPCQHEAYSMTEKRFAIAQGVAAFPEHLARGLDIVLDTRVSEISWTGSTGFHVQSERGEQWNTTSLVLTLPVEPTLAFLWPLSKHSQDIEAIATLLDTLGTLPCLTLMAGYEAAVPDPGWDVLYPETSDGLMLVSHDSSKRREPAWRVLVFQATPAWSRQHLAMAPEQWAKQLLAEASKVVGEWAAHPQWIKPHAWRHARVDLGNELSGPARITMPGGASLGLAGDAFAPGGGVEAAYCAGKALAHRLLQEDDDDGR